MAGKLYKTRSERGDGPREVAPVWIAIDQADSGSSCALAWREQVISDCGGLESLSAA